MFLVGVIIGFVGLLLLAAVLSPLWTRALDHASSNSRDKLPYEYELPRYFVRSKKGGVNTSARWPGWDAWTVCALPDDPALPSQMIRGTLMTGVYGLDGIDNYERITYRLDSREAVENLCLVPTNYALPDGGTLTLDQLSQQYLPRRSALAMSDAELDVRIAGARICGTWPSYRIELANPEAEMQAHLEFTGRRILWWADIPRYYTHFATFGDFQVTLADAGGADAGKPFRARGTVEHVFARRLPIPVRIPVLYHYEVLFGAALEGGFVHARAFGVDYRNGGGLYVNDGYQSIRRVRVHYLEFDRVDSCDGRGDPTRVPSRWEVDASTDAGPLRYTASRTHPPAMTGPNSSQYHFAFEGTWNGSAINGRGYGEYVRI